MPYYGLHIEILIHSHDYQPVAHSQTKPSTLSTHVDP